MIARFFTALVFRGVSTSFSDSSISTSSGMLSLESLSSGLLMDVGSICGAEIGSGTKADTGAAEVTGAGGSVCALGDAEGSPDEDTEGSDGVEIEASADAGAGAGAEACTIAGYKSVYHSHETCTITYLILHQLAWAYQIEPTTCPLRPHGHSGA